MEFSIVIQNEQAENSPEQAERSRFLFHPLLYQLRPDARAQGGMSLQMTL